MRFWIAALLLLVLGIAQTVSAAPKHSAANSDSVWVFDCEHFSTGKYRFFVWRDALKIVGFGNGAVALTKGPTWKVSYYRDNDKLEFTRPLAELDASVLSSLVKKKPAKKSSKCVFVGKGNYCNLPCLEYKLSGNHIYCVPEGMKTAPQVSEMFSKYFGFYLIDGVPVRIFKLQTAKSTAPPTRRDVEAARERKEKDKLAKAIPWLSVKNFQGKESDKDRILTLTGWKQVAFKASDFEYPKGYKQTEDPKQVILSKQQRAVIDELIDGLSH